MLTGDLRKALEVAIKAHFGQRDKSGEPYIMHPLTVVEYIEMPDKDLAVIGLLHDVVEDSDVTIEDLIAKGFSENVIEAVDVLTRRIEDPYSEYILKVKKNPFAVEVKKADLKHNMDPNRAYTISENLMKKYEKALAVLNDED